MQGENIWAIHTILVQLRCGFCGAYNDIAIGQGVTLHGYTARQGSATPPLPHWRYATGPISVTVAIENLKEDVKGLEA